MMSAFGSPVFAPSADGSRDGGARSSTDPPQQRPSVEQRIVLDRGYTWEQPWERHAGVYWRHPDVGTLDEFLLHAASHPYLAWAVDTLRQWDDQIELVANAVEGMRQDVYHYRDGQNEWARQLDRRGAAESLEDFLQHDPARIQLPEIGVLYLPTPIRPGPLLLQAEQVTRGLRQRYQAERVGWRDMMAEWRRIVREYSTLESETYLLYRIARLDQYHHPETRAPVQQGIVVEAGFRERY